MLPQPPPNAPSPPPSEAALRSRRQWRWILIVGLASIVLLMMLTPFFVGRHHHHRGTNQTEAVSNARQIGLAMFEFENEYGAYPNATTAAAVRAKTGTTLSLGTTTANDYFRQLIGSEMIQIEGTFYARIPGSHRPDRLIDAGHALEKGECGFSYLIGATPLSKLPMPLLVTPLIPGTDRFDPIPFDGKAVVLWTDNSASSLPIDKGGHVMHLGKHLLDPANPVWTGKPPVIAWPE